MTLVHNEMAVLGHLVAHDAFAHQALDDRYVKRAGRLFSAAADPSDVLGRQSEKRG